MNGHLRIIISFPLYLAKSLFVFLLAVMSDWETTCLVGASVALGFATNVYWALAVGLFAYAFLRTLGMTMNNVAQNIHFHGRVIRDNAAALGGQPDES